MFKPTLLGVFLFSLAVFFSCKDNAQTNKAEHKHTNALINETSPYLLQHAHNPVDWRPWSEEALEEAKKENKLVLVSIGYSSCHWCHVMEEETFEDEGIAQIMNENFINIKVDREERPDVDHVYMTALQLIKGNGGWPLNMIVLPNGKPLYGGTYHTKEQWSQVLTKITELYNNDPEKAAEYADMVAAGIAEANTITPVEDQGILNPKTLEQSVNNWAKNWDLEWGGDRGDQKFMIPSNLDFLMDYAELTTNESVKSHVENTLEKMALGGIYDHLGGGFFRYSTDAQWKVPHFEKMLYDNAQLLSLYSKAYKIREQPVYERVVRETIAFLDREMKNPEGGYYAAIDADSEGEEGKFYIWKEEELKTILKDDFKLFADYYNIKESAVWEKGNYVLHKLSDDEAFVQEHSISQADLDSNKQIWSGALLNARDKRVRPNIDDKVITSWNALLISGFVDAYLTFGNSEYLNRAEDIFGFLKGNCFENGQLIHSYKKGGKHVGGFLEDYAYLANASLNLYGATMKMEYLDFAQNLNRTAMNQFADEASGMFRYNKNDELIAKIIKIDDGVIPSPNAVMAHNLFQLGHIEYNRDFLKKSKTMLSSLAPSLSESGQNYAKWGALLLNVAFPYFEIAIVGKDATQLLKSIEAKHLPNTLVVGSTQESGLPLFKGRYVDESTYIYVCQDATCKLPVETLEEALYQMENF